MPSEIVLMLLLAHKDAAAYPPSIELQLDLFHHPRWWDLFNRRRTAPPGAHSQQHTRKGQLAGQVYGYYLVQWKRSKQSLGLTPDSALSSTRLSAEQSARAPICLALPCCFLQACKYANVYTALAPFGKAAYLLPCLLRMSSGAR